MYTIQIYDLNLSIIDFDFSMPSTVKFDGVAGLPIYDFLLVFGSNIDLTSNLTFQSL